MIRTLLGIMCSLLLVAPIFDSNDEMSIRDVLLCYGVSALFALASSVENIASKMKGK